MDDSLLMSGGGDEHDRQVLDTAASTAGKWIAF